MARPSMPKSTRISRAIRTIAWPSCRERFLVVLGTIDRICRDDEVVSDNLLDDRSHGLKRVPDGYFQWLVSVGGHCVQTSSRSRVVRKLAAWRIRNRWRTRRSLVAARAWIGDEDPTGVDGGFLCGAERIAAVGYGAVRTRVGQDDRDGVAGDGRIDQGVVRPVVRYAVGVDVVRRAHSHPRALVGGLLERDVDVKGATEIDDPERQQQDDRRDDRKLGQALRALALDVPRDATSH